MFCPKCTTEYQAGTTICADCNVALVAERPAPAADGLVEAEEILATYNVADILMIKSLLDANEIPYLFLGETFAVMDPLIQPARLLVAPEWAERVRELLKDLNLHYMGISTDRPELPDDGDEPSA
ncbi:MAG: putative signal transducing protein [Candidatus Krumholzibacteriia bacterium]